MRDRDDDISFISGELLRILDVREGRQRRKKRSKRRPLRFRMGRATPLEDGGAIIKTEVCIFGLARKSSAGPFARYRRGPPDAERRVARRSIK
ncbi:hypothetical protein Trydic_g9358 [Trypoxylus dichotomus]